MSSSESWLKNLNCPKCGREGQARLRQVDDPSNEYGFKTVVEQCPQGFRAQQDEDDSYILRFFCAADDVAADQ